MITPEQKQIVVDKIKSDFKGKAVHEVSKKCAYLTEDGRKCAVGLFMPDSCDLQNSELALKSLAERNPEIKEFLPIDNLNFWHNFQCFHDDLSNEDTVREQTEQMIKFVEGY